MDRLSQFLQRFSLSAGVFHSGQICGLHEFSPDSQRGHMHLIRRGPVTIAGVGRGPMAIRVPSLVLVTRPEGHRLIASEKEGADVVCASVKFGGGARNPITESLPPVLAVPLAELPNAAGLLELLYQEAFSASCGRQAALDRLCELLLIHLLRYCLDQGLARGGALAGMADPKLAKALTAMLDNPMHPWELAEMAQRAGMSRARFAVRFREVTGDSPGDFLAAWRIALAQDMLRAGRPLKQIATEVGYGSPSALSRAFARKTGRPPARWMREEAQRPLGEMAETAGQHNGTPGQRRAARLP